MPVILPLLPAAGEGQVSESPPWASEKRKGRLIWVVPPSWLLRPLLSKLIEGHVKPCYIGAAR